MLKKLFLIIVSLVIAFEMIAVGWMLNSYFESKHGSKVHSELVGKGMTPEEYFIQSGLTLLISLIMKRLTSLQKRSM